MAYSIQGATISDVTAEVNTLESSATSMESEIAASASNTILIDFITTDDADGITAQSGQTVLLDVDGDQSTGSSYKIVSAGTNTMGWDFAAQNDGEGAHSVIAIVPEPATMSLLAIGGLGALLKRKRS